MSTFVAQQVTCSHVIQVPAPIDRAFPLFEPLGERAWAHGWDPEMLFPASGVAQEGTVFLTRHASEPAKIWIIITYEKAQAHVTYINTLPEAYTSKIDVRCTPAGAEATSVCVTYTLTGLTAQGNEYIQHFAAEQHYQAYITSWETAIAHYLYQ